MISGTTRIIGIVGHPVSQVRMPGNLNPLFGRTGQDLAMVPFDLDPVAIPQFVGVLRALGNLVGTVVTVPHKQAMARSVDVLSIRALALGAVNVVRRDADGSLHGDHVDGFGFLNAARAHGFLSAGKQALVIGAGGAGSAIAYAFCEMGVAAVTVLDTDDERAGSLVRMLKSQFPEVDVKARCDTLLGLDLVVNVTPIGMSAQDPMPLPGTLLATLASSTLVCDAITVPEITPFLAFARDRGCQVQTGAEMARASVEFIGSFLRFLPEVDPVAVIAAPLRASVAPPAQNAS